MKFLKQGEQRCLNARKEATNALVDIDDLEVLQTPERYFILVFIKSYLYFCVLVSC
jgi:hypothetical protein